MSARLVAGLLAAALAQAAAAAEPQAQRSGEGLAWTYDVAHGDAVLRVADDTGAVREFTLGAQLYWSPRAAGLADGNYRYELSVAAPGAPANRLHAPQSQARAGGALASGHFTLRDGAIAPPETEIAAGKLRKPMAAAKDQTIADDLIVDGHLCVGFDCLENAEFGAMTAFVTENNLRIAFDDTSDNTQPDSDWELTANDSASGGASAFSFFQRNTGRPVFRMLAGAPGGSFWVDDQGRLALKSGLAAQHLHLVSGDEPGIRLAQDNTSGFTPSTWEMAIDEGGLRIADSLNGTVPFSIESGTPTGTLTVGGGARVGVGTPEPQSTLHVRRSDGSTRVRVEDSSAAPAPRVLAQLRNLGPPRLLLQGDAAGWTLQGDAGFAIATTAPAAGALQLAANGDLAISGTLSQGSSRALKHAIEMASPAALLEQVRALPLYAWQYTGDALGARHLGPMAEDVHAAFGFGGNERALAPGDVAALAMAAAQALRGELAERDAELEALLVRLERLEMAGGAR